MLIIESNPTISSISSWILDSGSSTYICTSMYGLIENKRLRQDDMILRIDNGTKIIVKAIRTHPLWLPSGFRLDLKDCYFVPVASWNLIAISVLAQDGFIFQFKKDYCSIYL